MNLRNHPQVAFNLEPGAGLSFNWPPLLKREHIDALRDELQRFTSKSIGGWEEVGALQFGHKSEGFAFSRHIGYVCKVLFPGLKMIFSMREPITWLQSMYNLRIHLRCDQEGLGSPGCVNNIENDFIGV